RPPARRAFTENFSDSEDHGRSAEVPAIGREVRIYDCNAQCIGRLTMRKRIPRARTRLVAREPEQHRRSQRSRFRMRISFLPHHDRKKRDSHTKSRSLTANLFFASP